MSSRADGLGWSGPIIDGVSLVEPSLSFRWAAKMLQTRRRKIDAHVRWSATQTMEGDDEP